MINQYLYGRKNSGYCQLNSDYSTASRDDDEKLKALQNYIVTDECDKQDLPIEYYTYSETIEGRDVRIEGTTFFVPAGTSQQSGARDTSIIHKYIYSGEDYKRCIDSGIDRKGRKFARFVEDYPDGGDSFEDETALLSLEEAWKAFRIDIHSPEGKKAIIQFAKDCIDAFPEPGKRVYVYLPKTDRRGSIYAKRIMEGLLDIMPASITRRSGFITWQSTFHSPSLNPIPGGISVVFLPDSADNRQKEKREKENHKIFDFVNGAWEDEAVGTSLKSFLQKMITAMVDGDSGEFEQLKEFLDKQLNSEASVDSEFLNCVFSLYIFSTKIKNIRKEGLSLADIAEKNNNLVLGGIDSIRGILRYESVLSDTGSEKVLETTGLLLKMIDPDEQMEAIDDIFSAGELCHETVLEYLCDKCLEMVRTQDVETEKGILNITNYEYADEDVNDLIIDKLYLEEKYQPVARVLFRMMIKPLLGKKDLSIFEKIQKLIKRIGKMSGQYPDFFRSKTFEAETKSVIADLLDMAEEEGGSPEASRREAFIEIHKCLEEAPDDIKLSFRATMEKTGYDIVSSFVNSGKLDFVTFSELKKINQIIDAYDLKDYESTHDAVANNIKQIYNKTAQETISRAIVSRDTRDIASSLTESYEKNIGALRKYCGDNLKEIEDTIADMIQTICEENLEATSDAFIILSIICDSRVAKKCMRGILKKTDINRFIQFAQKLLDRTSEKGKQKILTKSIAEVLDSSPENWKNEELTEEQTAFLKGVGLDIRKTYVPEVNTDDGGDNGDKRKGIMGLFGGKK